MSMLRHQVRSPARYRRLQNVQTNTVTVTNTTTETTLHTFTSSGDAPGPYRVFRVLTGGTVFNNTGAAAFAIYRLYVGTLWTTYTFIINPGASTLSTRGESTIVVTASGTSGAVNMAGTWVVHTGAPDAIASTVSGNSNLASSLVIRSSVALTTASVNMTATETQFIVETE